MNSKCRSHLRSLAGKYTEYALGDVMRHRKEKWSLHNRMQERTFPFHIEDNGTYLRDLPPSRMRRSIVSPFGSTTPSCNSLL